MANFLDRVMTFVADGRKPAVAISNFDKQKRDAISSTDASAQIAGMGINCGTISEPLAEPVRAPCETWYEGKNNASIVLGRDRPGSIDKGYGGKGNTQCGMVDIVVGRMSQASVESFKKGPEGKSTPVQIDPMFTPYSPLTHDQAEDQVAVSWASDAARIYISQMTDLDNNFKLKDGGVGNSIGRSGIGIKADAVRIIGNEGVKIVTNADGVNSYGQPLTNKGIDLIANNRARRDNAEYYKDGSKTWLKSGPTLQPLVKGDNLRACIDEILEEMIKLQSTMQGFVNQVIDVNTALGNHRHPPIVPTVPVFKYEPLHDIARDSNNTLGTKTMESLKGHIKNLDSIRNKFLNNTGKCFINSRFNNTN